MASERVGEQVEEFWPSNEDFDCPDCGNDPEDCICADEPAPTQQPNDG